MSLRRRELRVFPDGGRLEEALVRAARLRPFVDASGFCTLGQLFERMGADAPSRRPVASEWTLRLVLRAEAERLGGGPFGPWCRGPAFARAARALLGELKAGGLNPLSLRRACRALPASARDKAAWLSRLWWQYERALAVQGVTDPEAGLLASVQRLRDHGLPPALSGAAGLSLHAVHDFPPLRREWLRALAQACERAGVGLRLELPAGGGPGVDAAVDPVLQALEASAQDASRVEALKEDAALESGLGPLMAVLFTADPRPVSLPEGRLRLFRAASEREERRGVVLGVVRALEEGVPPEEIAIVRPGMAERADLLREELAAAGIPAAFRRGAPLSRTALGRAALSLPLLVERGFQAAPMEAVLAGRYAPALGRPIPEAGRWLAEAGVQDDRTGASGRTGAYDARLGALAGRLERRGRTKEAARVRTVLERCRAVLQLGTHLPETGTFGALLAGWWRAVEALGAVSQAQALDPVPEPEGALARALAEVQAQDQAAARALVGLTAALREAAEASGASRLLVTRAEFARWLAAAAAEQVVEPTGLRTGAVRLLDLRDVTGRRFQRLFLVGLGEAQLPAREHPPLLLGEDALGALNRHARREVVRLRTGDEEGRAAWGLAEQRLLFACALAAGERTVLAWPATVEGREQLPSPFIEELLRRTGLPVEVLPARPVPLLREALTETDRRARLALEALSPPSLRAGDPDEEAREAAWQELPAPWMQQARALSRMESERLGHFGAPESPPGPFTGHVPGVGDAVAFGPDRPLSAAALQRSANCAYQGFLADVLGLEGAEARGEDLDAASRGTLWHAVLEALFPALAERGLLGRAPEEVPEGVLDAAVESAVAEVAQKGHVGHPALWKLAQQRARAMAVRLLSSSHGGLPFAGLRPAGFELPFGVEEAPEGLRHVVLPPAFPEEQPIHFRGGIDRLDAAPGRVAVVDYKSGAVSRREEDLLATEYQLPLYLYAAAQAHPGAQLDGAWLGLRDGRALPLSQVTGGALPGAFFAVDADQRTAAREANGLNFANAVHARVGAMRRGEFPIHPRECGHCRFRPACRFRSDDAGEEAGP